MAPIKYFITSVICLVVPVITVMENPVIAVIGRTTSLSCLATGDPAPVQTWTRNGGAVSGSRVQISADGSNLTISDAREEEKNEQDASVNSAKPMPLPQMQG